MRMILRLIRMLFPNCMHAAFWWCMAVGWLAYTFIAMDFRRPVVVADFIAVTVYLIIWSLNDHE